MAKADPEQYILELAEKGLMQLSRTPEERREAAATVLLSRIQGSVQALIDMELLDPSRAHDMHRRIFEPKIIGQLIGRGA
jgi:hypothetical protein